MNIKQSLIRATLLLAAPFFWSDAPQSISAAPPVASNTLSSPKSDWLLDNKSFQASVHSTFSNRGIVMENGLIRRTFQYSPNGATVGFENLMTGSSIIRAVKPEATLTLNGKMYDVGGLDGQPEQAYLLPSWLEGLTNKPGSFLCTSTESNKKTVPPLQWKQKRHSENLAWPSPRGFSRISLSGASW